MAKMDYYAEPQGVGKMLLNPLSSHPDYETTLRELQEAGYSNDTMHTDRLINGIQCLPKLQEQYINLLKKCLTFTLYNYIDKQWPPSSNPRQPVSLQPVTADDLGIRMNGRDWPGIAETMIGMARLDNLQMCIERALEDDVEGDLIEAGVWRGGASIFMRGVLMAHGSDKHVYVADSFKGLPMPNVADYPQDKDSKYDYESLKCSQKMVQSNFARYGLMDEQVHFIEGWFKDTLPKLADRKWAVIRLDGDMYESTMQSLDALYPQLERGGYCIVDDYNSIGTCRDAVNDYRAKHGITDSIVHVDWTGVYWRKS